MILILASVQDVHARRVATLLARNGAEVRILDCSHFGNGAFLNYPISGGSTTIDVNGEKIVFDATQAVWYRRPRLTQVANSVRDQAIHDFCRQEWANTLDGLFINSPAKFVNPLLSEFAAVKPRQLLAAASVGLITPETLITNHPEEAEEFIDRHRGDVVHKALTAPRDRLIETRRWSEADRAALKRLPLAPTIFQERIRGPADVRVTVVGNEIFAAKIETAKGRAEIDSRMDLDATYVAHKLPTNLEDQLQAFMSTMGLVYGTIDLKISESGNYVFFEVNPQGQFLYIEILTGLPISEALADFLARDGS
jgi:hypothetical protein